MATSNHCYTNIVALFLVAKQVLNVRYAPHRDFGIGKPARLPIRGDPTGYAPAKQLNTRMNCT